MAELLSELLERCRRGDKRAAESLVLRFQAWARDLAEAFIGDAHLAEDAVQAAFVRALSRLADLRDPAAFAGWLRQIIRTEAHRIARRRTEAQWRQDEAVPAGALTPLERLETEDLRRLVREALAKLPPADRSVAELYYIEQRGGAEVAELLDVPQGTVRRRLHDARRRLRQMLLEYVDDVKPQPKDKGRRRLPL